MKILSIKGLNSRANMVLNHAFELANSVGDSEVTTLHVMFVILGSPDIAKLFTTHTGIEVKEFLDHCELFFNTAKNNKNNKNEDHDNLEYPSVGRMSEELFGIITSAIGTAVNNNRLVTIYDLYNMIIKNKDGYLYKAISEMGMEEAVKPTGTSPLEEMPTTSKFGVDYNVLAREGKFDTIDGRADIIENIFEILGRRIKNNPCLVGESGVGKTAIVEGIAQKIVSGDVPWYLKDKHIISIDISKVVSGSKFRGDFEEKLNGIIDEVSHRNDIILFFDEFHMLAEAGGSTVDSAMTASNIIKPSLSTGGIQLIGATTFTEYKKFIEEDKAFERRVQKVVVAEPNVEAAILMVKAVIPKYESFHNVSFSSEAIKSAVILSDRYITNKRLPDKAITVLDEAAAKFKEEKRKKKIETAEVKEVISKISGVDIKDLDDADRVKLTNLKSSLDKVVVCQESATEVVSKAILRNKAGIKDPNKPIGSFLFVGPTGVGKTELSKALADQVCGGRKNLIRFDMSEFMEKHTVSRLIGSPPGYVGYGEGGQLTEAVRNNPYCIILFDEIEKAHSDIFNIMLQILDEGQLSDSSGLKVDFKNTIIIMTSNIGYSDCPSTTVGRIGFGDIESSSKDDENSMAEIEKLFRPEFLNRLDKIVVFKRLDKNGAKKIAKIYMSKLTGRLAEKKIKLKYKNALVDKIVDLGFSDKYGARNISRTVQSLVEDGIADYIINGEIVTGDEVVVDYTDELNIKINRSLYGESNKKEVEAIKG